MIRDRSTAFSTPWFDLTAKHTDLDTRRWMVWAGAWLACTIATLALVANTTRARIDPDEIYWVGSAYYYHLAFEQGDWRGSHPDWKLLPARENPPVAKYVLGLGLALSGRHVTTLDGLGSFFAYFASILGNPVQEHAGKQAAVMARMDPALLRHVAETRQMYIAPDLLIAARRVMLVCGIVTSLLVFALGASALGWATGLLASQLLLLHPTIRFSYDHAMADAVGFMFGTAAALAAWQLYLRFGHRLRGPQPTRRTAIGIGVLNGALLGLACGAKMNWLTVALLFGATVVAAAAQAWRQGDRNRVTLAIGAGLAGFVSAFAVFVIANPSIVAQPVEGLIAVVREPALTTAVQARVLVTQTHLLSVGARLGAVGTLMLGAPWIFALVMLMVALACVRAPKPGAWFIAAWWGIAFVCVTAWIPFEWKRYVLPITIPFVILVAHALVAAGSALIRRRHEPARD